MYILRCTATTISQRQGNGEVSKSHIPMMAYKTNYLIFILQHLVTSAMKVSDMITCSLEDAYLNCVLGMLTFIEPHDHGHYAVRSL
jgi:hypothetical protein